MQMGWGVAGVFHLSWQLPLLSSAPTSDGAAVPVPGFCTPTVLLVQGQCPGGWDQSLQNLSQPNSPTAAAGHGKAAERSGVRTTETVPPLWNFVWV